MPPRSHIARYKVPADPPGNGATMKVPLASSRFGSILAGSAYPTRRTDPQFFPPTSFQISDECSPLICDSVR